jgi:glycosyltransferase involved in cell wall biosynthesis
MRVLIFSTVYAPLIGGAEVAMEEVTDRIPDIQFDLICAKVKPGLPKTEQIGNVTVHRCGWGSPIDKYLLPILGVARAMRVSSFEFRVSSPGSNARNSQLATRNFPVVWSLMASYGGFAALVYTWLRPRSKVLLTLQEGDPLEHYAKRTGMLTFLHRRIFERANAVQAISRFLADWAVKMGFKGKPEVVPNGVDIAKFSVRISTERRNALRASYGFEEDDIVLVTASRLSLKNGVDDLIRSLVSLPSHVKALIAGDGEDRDKLRVLAEQKGLASRVVFLGSKSHEELPEILQCGDVFVRASLSEGLGNAFLEAMAAGIPIIGTPVGGIPDFLKDGETGVFCQPRDPKSIANAVIRLFGYSVIREGEERAFRERLISNGERMVREGYDWDGIASRIRAMLIELARV